MAWLLGGVCSTPGLTVRSEHAFYKEIMVKVRGAVSPLVGYHGNRCTRNSCDRFIFLCYLSCLCYRNNFLALLLDGDQVFFCAYCLQ